MPVKHPPGFTLVELLVVITIIVLLLALLAPALDRAISQAESALCMTNEAQLSRATSMYSLDFKGKVVYVTGGRPQGGAGGNWPYRLAPYLGAPSFGKGSKPFSLPLVDVGKTPVTPGSGFTDGFAPATQCPTTPNLGTTGWGTADTAWLNGCHSSYAMSGWVTTYTGFGHNTDSQRAKFFSRLRDAPSSTPLFSDATTSLMYPESNDGFPGHDTKGDTYEGTRDGNPGFCMGLICIDRHAWAVNVSFVDGHAEHVRLGDLWLLPWHKDYVGSDRYRDVGPTP